MKIILTGFMAAIIGMFATHLSLLALDKEYDNDQQRVQQHIEFTKSFNPYEQGGSND